MSAMTFEESYQRAKGYAARIMDTEGNMTLHSMLVDIKKAHEEEVKQALCRFPLFHELTEYDTAGNARHKALCDLRKWDPDKVQPFPGERDTHIKILYQILTGNAGGNVSASDAAKAVRDKLVELLEA